MTYPIFNRRRFIQGGLALLLAGGLNLTAQAAEPNDTLVLYLSRTGNNKTLAEFIARETDSTLAAIETVKPYPQNYQQMRDQAAKEISDGILPTIKPLPDLSRYRRIVLVFPTWAMSLPAPVRSFLRRHNLNGKTLLPLNTNAGYGVGSGFEEIKQRATGAEVKTGLSLKGGNEREGRGFVMQGDTLKQAQRQIRAWLNQAGK
ncbi:flavodoxin-like protein [Cricetibacter osteomyelitidis]|uniref:Flavodoxin-like protein n=1 Tax=Cricetibacter osteomyelitidis TaxID=1521931 RepID=A0A4R2T3F7_9PAST|nr:flavodoxin [Cricetibacter osteomyelitidis]TCP95981.1 flavodoxin-like protein [Cricetibacter osteomyelitidis]